MPFRCFTSASPFRPVGCHDMSASGMIPFLHHFSETEYFHTSNATTIAPAYESRGGSLRDRASVPGAAPGTPGRLGSWITGLEPGGAWDRDRSFLSPSVWHTDGSLTADPRPAGFPAGPVNHSPGFVRSSCCFLQLLHTQIT